MPSVVRFTFVAIDKFKNVSKSIAKNVTDITKKTGKLGRTNTEVSNKVFNSNKKIGRSFNLLNNKFKVTEKNAGRLSKKLRKLSKDTSKSANSISKSSNMMGGFAGKVAATAGTFFSISEFIKTGGNFQDALADLQAITGAAGEDLNFLSGEALRLAKSSSFAQDKVVKAFTDIASAKSELLKDPRALSTITEQSLMLANAAGIDLESAVQASVGALNQFNVGADQAARFTNVLAAGSKVGAARVSDIVESLKNAGPVAAQFNVSFEDTNAILQVLAKNGVKGAEAGTALRAALVKLETKLGAMAPSKVGFVRTLEILRKRQLSNVQLSELFGEEHVKTGLILQNNIPLIKQWGREITGTNIAEEQASIRLNTFNAKLRRMGVTIRESVIKAFIRLEPVITEQITNLTKWIDSLDPEKIKGFADSLTILVKGLVFVGKIVGKILKQMEMIGEVLGQLTAALATLDFSQFDLFNKKPKQQKNIEQINKERQEKFDQITQKVIVGRFGREDLLQNLARPNVNAVMQATQVEKMLTENKLIENSFKRTEQFTTTKTKADVVVSLKAPPNTVESVRTVKTGDRTPDLNIGVNMAAQL